MMQIAEIVTKTEAALGEVHHYYKFGRHLAGFPQKPYFLFSHCAHLLFSLWLIEQDNPSGLFAESSSLTAIVEKLDLAPLRYADYSRRMLYANAYEEHLKNEPKWFKFWVKLLHELQGADAASCEEFARQFAACQTEGSLLEGKLARRDQKVLAALVQGPRAGRLLLHSIWVLEDMISTASEHIAADESASHDIEQMQCLVCLLSQLRRAVVWEAPARGPFSLSASSPWGAPSALARLFSGRTPGLLAVALQEEGGEVACTYTWTSGSQTHQRAWVRGVPALSCAYEEALFKTWPLEAPAHWVLPALEADHLEAIAQHAVGVLGALGRRPAYGGFVASVAKVIRNGQSRWTAAKLPWSYIHTLDQLIGKLKFACREAKVLGGENPGEKVIANLWPSQPAATQDPMNRETDGVTTGSSGPSEQTLPGPAPDDRERFEPVDSAAGKGPVVIGPSGQSRPHEVIHLAGEAPASPPVETQKRWAATEPESMRARAVTEDRSPTRQTAAPQNPDGRRIDMLTQLIGLLLDDEAAVSEAERGSSTADDPRPGAVGAATAGTTDETLHPSRSGAQDGR
jgi:hypothetical protein